MSAIGSVIIGCASFLATVPRLEAYGEGCCPSGVRPTGSCLGLPARLGHAGQLAGVRHLAQADPAQAELAVHGVRAPAALAPGVGAYGEPRLGRGLVDQCLLRHASVLLEREAERPKQRA